MDPAEPLRPGSGRDLARVRPDRHGGMFWRRFTSWEFARAQRLVPIVLGEHEQVAASLPIVFMRNGAGLWPVALTRLTEAGTCALVSPGGQWRGSYVPSVLRVHPFSVRRAEAGEPELLVDEASGLVTEDPGDERFFDEGGDPAPAMREVIAFFHERTSAQQRTRTAMSEVAARAPLVPLTAPAGGPQMDVQGLFVPDPARIEGLGRADLGALHRCGALALLQAQAVSMHHLPFLAAAEARLDQSSPHQPAEAAAGVAGGDAVLSGFLDALAQSRDRDTGDGGGNAGENDIDVNMPFTARL